MKNDGVDPAISFLPGPCQDPTILFRRRIGPTFADACMQKAPPGVQVLENFVSILRTILKILSLHQPHKQYASD